MGEPDGGWFKYGSHEVTELLSTPGRSFHLCFMVEGMGAGQWAVKKTGPTVSTSKAMPTNASCWFLLHPRPCFSKLGIPMLSRNCPHLSPAQHMNMATAPRPAIHSPGDVPSPPHFGMPPSSPASAYSPQPKGKKSFVSKMFGKRRKSWFSFGSLAPGPGAREDPEIAEAAAVAAAAPRMHAYTAAVAWSVAVEGLVLDRSLTMAEKVEELHKMRKDAEALELSRNEMLDALLNETDDEAEDGASDDKNESGDENDGGSSMNGESDDGTASVAESTMSTATRSVTGQRRTKRERMKRGPGDLRLVTELHRAALRKMPVNDGPLGLTLEHMGGYVRILEAKGQAAASGVVPGDMLYSIGGKVLPSGINDHSIGSIIKHLPRPFEMGFVPVSSPLPVNYGDEHFSEDLACVEASPHTCKQPSRFERPPPDDPRGPGRYQAAYELEEEEVEGAGAPGSPATYYTAGRRRPSLGGEPGSEDSANAANNTEAGAAFAFSTTSLARCFASRDFASFSSLAAGGPEFDSLSEGAREAIARRLAAEKEARQHAELFGPPSSDAGSGGSGDEPARQKPRRRSSGGTAPASGASSPGRLPRRGASASSLEAKASPSKKGRRPRAVPTRKKSFEL